MGEMFALINLMIHVECKLTFNKNQDEIKGFKASYYLEYTLSVKKRFEIADSLRISKYKYFLEVYLPNQTVKTFEMKEITITVP